MSGDRSPIESVELSPFHGDPLLWEPEEHSLVDLINRVLDRGVVITGEVTLSVAGVELVYLGLSAVLTSVSTARRLPDGADPDPEG